MSKNIRVLTTDQLFKLNRAARRSHFNRTLSTEWMKKSVDPDGIHVAELVLYGHNMDSAPILHHRLRVLVKVNGTNDPERVTLDVAASEWQKLLTVERFQKNLELV